MCDFELPYQSLLSERMIRRYSLLGLPVVLRISLNCNADGAYQNFGNFRRLLIIVMLKLLSWSNIIFAAVFFGNSCWGEKRIHRIYIRNVIFEKKNALINFDALHRVIYYTQEKKCHIQMICKKKKYECHLLFFCRLPRQQLRMEEPLILSP